MINIENTGTATQFIGNCAKAQSPTKPAINRAPGHKLHQYSLPDNVVACLQQITSTHSRPQRLISAVRVLHFRCWGLEKSSLLVSSGAETQTVDIIVDENTRIEHVMAACGCVDWIRADLSSYEYFEVTSAIDGISYLFSVTGSIECFVAYDTSLHSTSAIYSVAAKLTDVLSAVLFFPGLFVTQIHFPGAIEQLKFLESPLRPPSKLALPKTIIDGFEKVVSEHGSRTALIQSTLVCTYQELDTLSTRLAYELLSYRGSGHQANEMIAFCIPPSPITIITMLAILKTGCAYVPIDVRQAKDRTLEILQSLGNPFVIITKGSPSFVHDGSFSAPKIDVTDFIHRWQFHKTSDLQVKKPDVLQQSELACLLYTSGTTGKPKGVRLLQRGVLALATADDAMPLKIGDQVAQINNLAWDAHILDVWCPLLRGATVINFSRFDVLDSSILASQFANYGITVCFFATAMLRHILGRNPRLLKILQVVFTGGEMLRYEDLVKAKAVNPELTIHNVYGPTECTTFVTKIPVKLSSSFPVNGPLPIGIPISTAQLVVLDSLGRLVPPGVMGEIHIRGEGVADGYHLSDAETKAAFVERQIFGVTDVPYIFYRTGDQGRWNPRGQLEFMGRINSDQIKIRGQRLELNDVETNMARASDMKEVAVAYHQPNSQIDGHLLGYLVPEPESEHSKALEHSEGMLVETWQHHWDESYSDKNIVFMRENFIGWDSMITGQPMPHDEMKAWLRDTLRPFFHYQPRKVFEIGCGIGILLYGMISSVDHFYGIEASGAGVQQLKQQLVEDGFSEKASIWHAPADQFQNLPDFDADLVVINSVAQYFPSLTYLETVLLNAVGRCQSGGQVFVGDVRSAALSDLLEVEILLEEWKSCLSEKTFQVLSDEVNRRQRYATELLVDPAFFLDLQRRNPRITHLEVLPKFIPHMNELSCYRYQVILHVGGEPVPFTPDQWLSPDEEDPFFENLPSLLKDFVSSDSSESFLALERIPNRFLQWGRYVVETITAASAQELTSLDMFNPRASHNRGWSPSDLENVAQLYDTELKLSCARQSEGGILDAVFLKPQAKDRMVNFPASGNSSHLRIDKGAELTYKRKLLDRASWEVLMANLRTKLPDFMIPEALFVIDQIPMTLNSKTDRRMLSRMAALDWTSLHRDGLFVDHVYSSESELLVCKLFSDFLGRLDISPSTDFFSGGGHSLLATQLRNALQEKFNVKIPLKQIFDTPTPEQISSKIAGLQKMTTSEIISSDREEDTASFHDLSHAQFRLWYLDQLNPGDRWYTSGLVLRSDALLNEEVLEQTISMIADRHDVLRTIYVEHNGIPKCRVLNEKPNLEKVDISSVEAEESVKSIVVKYAVRPFALESQPPFRPVLFRWGSQHIIQIGLHHIVTDGFSNDIWKTEMNTIYTSLLKGGVPQLPALPIQYQDYARWQRSSSHQKSIQPQLDTWVSHLKGSQPARLPMDFKRTSILSPGGTSILTINKDLKDRLEFVRKRYRVTWFMLLMATFRAVQFQQTGQQDASIGNPIANRHRSELEPLLGFFVNTQVFRLQCQQGMPFIDLLNQTRDRALMAFENQDVPFDKLVEMLRPDRDAIQNPLVELILAFQTNKTQPFDLAGTRMSTFALDLKASRFDLEIHWWDRGDTLRCVFFFRTDVFKQSTVDKLGQDLESFLETVAADPMVAIWSEHTPSEAILTTPKIRNDKAAEAANLRPGPDGPPVNQSETEICRVFEEVLGRMMITRQSNFFHYGGHSLLVTLACSKLRPIFGIHIGIRDVFESPTPASLAERVQCLLEERSRLKLSELDSDEGRLPTHDVFNPMPHKPFLFCLPMATGLGTIFYDLAMASSAFNTVALNDPFICGSSVVRKQDPSRSTLQELADLYYRQIVELERDLQLAYGQDSSQNAPLNILGYSFGGNVAIEVARIAAQRDKREVGLFLLDCADSSALFSVAGVAVEQNLADLPPETSEAIIKNLVNSVPDVVLPEACSEKLPAEEDIASRIRFCIEANFRRLSSHKTTYYPGSAVLFLSEGNAMHGLSAKFESLNEIVLEGSHYHLLQHSKEQLDMIVNRIAENLL